MLPSTHESHVDLLKHYPVRFQTASSLLGLNSGITELDKLLGFIPKGRVVFIQGSRSRKHLLELFCLQAISQYQNYCIFIDGGNSFDPYLLSGLASASRKIPKEVLSRVIISRAFTCHQLASLIVKEAEKIVDSFPSNLVAVSDMLHLFTDKESEIDKFEIEMIVPKMLKSLKGLTGQKNVIVVVTSDASNYWLDRMVESFSDIVLVVDGDKETIHVSLEKHPSCQKASMELRLKHELDIVKPAAIESWLMVNG